MVTNRRAYHIFNVLKIDTKLYKLKTQPLHPTFVAYKNLRQKLGLAEAIPLDKITCGNIELFLSKYEIYKSLKVKKIETSYQKKVISLFNEFLDNYRFQ